VSRTRIIISFFQKRVIFSFLGGRLDGGKGGWRKRGNRGWFIFLTKRGYGGGFQIESGGGFGGEVFEDFGGKPKGIYPGKL
jgi:hypothetical protein